MARDLIIVDSCVFIKAFRKDAKAINDLKPITDRTAYSVVTLELLVGANTPEKKGLSQEFLNPTMESL